MLCCYVMSCHVMSCHVMSYHVMSCHVMLCNVAFWQRINCVVPENVLFPIPASAPRFPLGDDQKAGFKGRTNHNQFPPINPLSPDIKMHILLTVLHTFVTELGGRICLNIKTSYPW